LGGVSGTLTRTRALRLAAVSLLRRSVTLLRLPVTLLRLSRVKESARVGALALWR